MFQKLLADTQQKMLEHIVENNASSITNNNINNINNSKNIETLNNITINLFLNEHCKDALNLTDFVNNIKYQLEDVLTAGENGHRIGIQNVMLKNLEDMPVTERPIHCKDQKRGVYVVKEDGEWADDSKGTTMTDAMKKISLGSLKGVLETSIEPLVSIDYNHNPASSTFDLTQTEVIGGRLGRVLSWYDNEWGFANRMSDTASVIGKLI